MIGGYNIFDPAKDEYLRDLMWTHGPQPPSPKLIYTIKYDVYGDKRELLEEVRDAIRAWREDAAYKSGKIDEENYVYAHIVDEGCIQLTVTNLDAAIQMYHDIGPQLQAIEEKHIPEMKEAYRQRDEENARSEAEEAKTQQDGWVDRIASEEAKSGGVRKA